MTRSRNLHRTVAAITIAATLLLPTTAHATEPDPDPCAAAWATHDAQQQQYAALWRHARDTQIKLDRAWDDRDKYAVLADDLTTINTQLTTTNTTLAGRIDTLEVKTHRQHATIQRLRARLAR